MVQGLGYSVGPSHSSSSDRNRALGSRSAALGRPTKVTSEVTRPGHRRCYDLGPRSLWFNQIPLSELLEIISYSTTVSSLNHREALLSLAAT